jgi:hypothetical protein
MPGVGLMPAIVLQIGACSIVEKNLHAASLPILRGKMYLMAILQRLIK